MPNEVFANRSEYVQFCRNNWKNLVSGGTPVVRYLRKNNGTPKGVAVVFEDEDGNLKLGWSLCNSKDTFIRHVGLWKAVQRARHVDDVGYFEMPSVMFGVCGDALDRAEKYFKVSEDVN
jgi:hypothetical protein